MGDALQKIWGVDIDDVDPDPDASEDETPAGAPDYTLPDYEPAPDEIPTEEDDGD